MRLRVVMSAGDRIRRTVRRLPAWPIYGAGAALAIWLFWRAATGGLGVDPVKAIERQLGLWGLQMIVVALCISPLHRFAGLNLTRYRRAIGLTAFGFILLHVLAWLVLDMGLLWSQALGDIARRPYVTIGMVGFLALVPPAALSNDWSIRRLGAARWRRWQRLAYVAALAGAVHYLWLVKAWPVEPFAYLGAIVALLALRVVPRRRRATA